jgi:hypothetical protein
MIYKYSEYISGMSTQEFDEDGRLFTDSEVDSNMGAGNIKTEYINIEIIINTIKEILNKVKCSEIDPKNSEENTKLLKILQEEYKDFSITHPVVLRWMVEARQYDEQAFRTYAKNHVKSTYKDRNEFWKCQGEYLILLFRRLNPKASVKAIRHYRDNVMGLLKKDNDEFDDANKKADEEIKIIKAKEHATRIDNLKILLSKLTPT